MPIDKPDQKLGINGFGRIGKLFLWSNLGRKRFGEVVVNIGRKVGASLTDIAHYVERDSTYGLLRSFLYGYGAKPLIEEVDEESGIMVVDGVTVRFLRSTRNPAEIPWR
ncbi:MAG: glyceraldehyde-3-phosphate dehydrogenase, partial [Proteobacteria bacterium]|nr:glyceraldehyde-3-phosphate dehydrogenase [Pseudomonadota bacterium]